MSSKYDVATKELKVIRELYQHSVEDNEKLELTLSEKSQNNAMVEIQDYIFKLIMTISDIGRL